MSNHVKDERDVVEQLNYLCTVTVRAKSIQLKINRLLLSWVNNDPQLLNVEQATYLDKLYDRMYEDIQTIEDNVDGVFTQDVIDQFTIIRTQNDSNRATVITRMQ